jgi:hypothetical protein
MGKVCALRRALCAKPAPDAASEPPQAVAVAGEKFSDPRWVSGTWDFAQFKAADGETDWDAVIDAEVRSCVFQLRSATP